MTALRKERIYKAKNCAKVSKIRPQLVMRLHGFSISYVNQITMYLKPSSGSFNLYAY